MEDVIESTVDGRSEGASAGTEGTGRNSDEGDSLAHGEGIAAGGGEGALPGSGPDRGLRDGHGRGEGKNGRETDAEDLQVGIDGCG